MKPAKYRNYLLVVLASILAFNPADRLALGLLLQDIKVDLSLSDIQLGLLSGIAFALFYSVMGVPIARWADRGNRVTIISLTTLLWSVAVALCGAVTNFIQLLLVRVAVAVGESGCMPPAHSLIADHFTRGERPRATARYMLGLPVSVVIGYFIAGWINEFYGWRVTFVWLGVPGVVLAAIAWFTLSEPRLAVTGGEQKTGSPQMQAGLREVGATLAANPTFRHLLLAYAVGSFFSAGILQWKPTFFVRSYGMDTGELGTWFAITYLVGGLIGTYWGGEWATRRAARNETRQLRAISVLFSIFGIVSALIYLSPNMYIALVLMGVTTAAGSATNGPLFATIQTLVPERMRAVSISIILLFANFIGMGLGPVLAGVLSEAFRPWAGDESLRYSLLALSPGYFWCAWHVWQGSKTVAYSLRQTSDGPGAQADGDVVSDTVEAQRRMGIPRARS